MGAGQFLDRLQRSVVRCLRQDRVGVVVELIGPAGGGGRQQGERGEAAHDRLRVVGESLRPAGMVRHRAREYDARTGVLIAMPEAAEPLTVAIPFYKGQDYLRRAIESVLRQSSPDWRLVVCDDGPEPGTAE